MKHVMSGVSVIVMKCHLPPSIQTSKAAARPPDIPGQSRQQFPNWYSRSLMQQSAGSEAQSIIMCAALSHCSPSLLNLQRSVTSRGKSLGFILGIDPAVIVFFFLFLGKHDSILSQSSRPSHHWYAIHSVLPLQSERQSVSRIYVFQMHYLQEPEKCMIWEIGIFFTTQQDDIRGMC